MIDHSLAEPVGAIVRPARCYLRRREMFPDPVHSGHYCKASARRPLADHAHYLLKNKYAYKKI